jgi:DNA-binding NarL/FixJ family response regulator
MKPTERDYQLAQRIWDVVRLHVEGYHPPTIARLMGLSLRTITRYLDARIRIFGRHPPVTAQPMVFTADAREDDVDVDVDV